MTTPIDPNDKTLWDNYVRAWDNYRNHRWQLTQQASNLTQVIEHGIAEGRRTLIALELLYNLPTEERISFFSRILDGATSQNPYLPLYSQLLWTFPKQWLIDNIEKYAEPLIERWHDHEVYSHLLGIYQKVDKELAIRLAHHAIENEDEDVRELGEWWLKKFNR